MDVTGLLILCLILLLCGAALAAALLVLMARGLLRPPRMTDAKALYVLKRLSPGDLEMPFEDEVRGVRDTATGRMLRMPAWWIPAPQPSQRTCILVHGYGDAKIGVIAWAPVFRKLGFNVLAIDLRAHGEADGDFLTAGYFERHDLGQIIDQVRLARPAATETLVLFGVSLGAAVVAATAALRTDVAAVVLESPYAHFVNAAATHGRRMGMPLVRWQPLVVRLAERMAGARFDEVAPTRLIPLVPCPLMLIHSACDTLVEPADAAALVAAMEARPEAHGPTVLWEAPGATHVLGLQIDPDAYQQQLGAFLDAALHDRPDPRTVQAADCR